jgi:outer membrane protein
MRIRKTALKCAALLLFSLFFLRPTAAQGLKYGRDFSRNTDWFPRIYKPYQAEKVFRPELKNSTFLTDLIVGGKLRISLAQLKSAVSENNLDILSSANSARYAETDLLRAKGGGAPRGGAGVLMPSSLFAGAIGAGVGGSSSLGSFSSAGITGGARQVSGVSRGSYDPSLAIGFSMDRTTSPLNSLIVSGLPEVTTDSIAFQARYSQAFTTGSSVSVAFNNMRQSSTQKFLLYNPNFISQLSISFTQQLLNGFGTEVGRRFLQVANNETKILNESVRLQVNTTLAQAQNSYWDLVAARENVRVAEESLEVARRFYQDNKTKEEIGSVSGLDVTTAASELAARERNLAGAQAALQMREVELKNVISMDLTQMLVSVQVESADPLPEPKGSDIPQYKDILAAAMANRSEIRQAEVNLNTQDIAIKYGKNLLKPNLLVFANFNSSGLYGNRVVTVDGSSIVLPGGLAQAWRQIRRWNYPEYAVGFSFTLNIRNRAAEADIYRSKLERTQTETSLQRTRNSISLEVRDALIGLVQSKAQVEAAHKAAELSGQTLAAEESRLLEGMSIPYEVIRRQRDHLSARSSEVQARANYAKALVELNRAAGQIAN